VQLFFIGVKAEEKSSYFSALEHCISMGFRISQKAMHRENREGKKFGTIKAVSA
jgi:hypothetical protein